MIYAKLRVALFAEGVRISHDRSRGGNFSKGRADYSIEEIGCVCEGIQIVIIDFFRTMLILRRRLLLPPRSLSM